MLNTPDPTPEVGADLTDDTTASATVMSDADRRRHAILVAFDTAGIPISDGHGDGLASEVHRVVGAVSKTFYKMPIEHELPGRDVILDAVIASSSVSNAETADRHLRAAFSVGGEHVHQALCLCWHFILTGPFRTAGIDGRVRPAPDAKRAEVEAAQEKATADYYDAIKRAAIVLTDETIIPLIELEAARRDEKAKRLKTGPAAVARLAAQAHKSAMAAAADAEKLASAIGETAPYDGGNMRSEYVRNFEHFAGTCAELADRGSTS